MCELKQAKHQIGNKKKPNLSQKCTLHNYQKWRVFNQDQEFRKSTMYPWQRHNRNVSMKSTTLYITWNNNRAYKWLQTEYREHAFEHSKNNKNYRKKNRFIEISIIYSFSRILLSLSLDIAKNRQHPEIFFTHSFQWTHEHQFHSINDSHCLALPWLALFNLFYMTMTINMTMTWLFFLTRTTAEVHNIVDSLE